MTGGARGLLALIMAAAFIFTGCGGYSTNASSHTAPPDEEPPVSGPLYQPGSRDIVFAISRDADDILREAARYFCDEYERLTGGSAIIMDAIAPDADLLAGRAHVAFLNKKRQYEFNELLWAASTPFLYSGYESFALSTGAGEITQLISASLKEQRISASLKEQNGLVPLGAFYQGALHFLTDTPVSGYQQLGGSTFAVSETLMAKTDGELRDEDFLTVTERLDAFAVTADTDDGRFALYQDGEANVAELSLEYIAAAGELGKPSWLTLSYHNLIPVWLIADEDFYSGLGDDIKAELKEAVASINYMIDSAYLKADEAALEIIRQRDDVDVSFEFASVRNRVFNALAPLADNASAQRKLARDLVGAIRVIGYYYYLA